MKCTIFTGETPEATVSSFNTWAKGKALTRDVLIHSVATRSDNEYAPDLMILVYHPEGKPWEETPKVLTAPVHNEPEPHIHAEEIRVIG